MKAVNSIIDELNELVPLFSNLKTLKELSVAFEKHLNKLFDIQWWGIYLYDFEEQRFRILYAEGFTDEKLKEIEQEAMNGFPGIVFRTSQMIYYPDMDEVREKPSSVFQHDFKVRSRIYIPLLNNKKCVGTFGAISSTVGNFTDENIAVLTFLCNLAGMAYGNILNRQNLRLANIEISEFSKIAEESPHPIMRISHSYFLLYANHASDNLLNYYGIRRGVPLPDAFKKHIDTALALNTSSEHEFPMDNQTYSFVFAPIAGTDYVNIYGLNITKRKKYENDLHSVYFRLSTLIKNMNAGILVEDENRKIALMNQKFCNYFNIPVQPEVLYGQDCSNSTEQSKHLFTDPEKFIERINQLLKEKKPVLNEELVMTDNRYLSRDYIPVYADSIFLGNLWQYRDITLQKEEEKQLSEAKHSAEQATLAKSLFLANMSHEIRTPMNAIYGIAKILNDYHQNEEQHKLIKGLTASAESLLSIINDILDFSKIEAGLLILDPATFKLKEQFLRIMDSMEFKANEKFINLKLNYDENIYPYQYSDSTRLKQVLTNLVNNAIKFTDQGNVEIGCRLLEEDKEYNTLQFQVKDTGIGIDEKNLHRIFENFQQEETGTFSKFGGTGLGLSISKQIVEKMGGEILVSSKKGKGSTFSFQLKIKKGNKNDYIEANAGIIIDPMKLAGKEVLVVEDIPINQFVVRSIIEKWNIKVTSALNGKEAIDLLKHQRFDLILMDKQMPEMDGIETTCYIRGKMNLKIPIIALTANIVKEVIDQCLQAGMNDYVSKPFEPHVLYEKIANLLGIPVNRVFETSKETVQADPEEKIYDLSTLEEMLDKDQDKVKEIIDHLKKHIPQNMEELMGCYQAGNMKELAQSAHKFKSTIQLIGNNTISGLIKTIENNSSGNKNLDELSVLIVQFEIMVKDLMKQLNQDFQEF